MVEPWSCSFRRNTQKEKKEISFTFFKINAYAPLGTMQDQPHRAGQKGKILKAAVTLQNSNCNFKQWMHEWAKFTFSRFKLILLKMSKR